jgi:hypothetical protein
MLELFVRFFCFDNAERAEEGLKKKGVSHSKKEATKDMVSRWSNGGQGCSKDARR